MHFLLVVEFGLCRAGYPEKRFEECWFGAGRAAFGDIEGSVKSSL